MVYVHLSPKQFVNLSSLLGSLQAAPNTSKQQLAQIIELQTILQAAQTRPLRCCLNDGQPIASNAVVVRLPNRQKKNGEYGFFPYVFCSVSCMKTYLETRNNFSPHLLVWLTIHAKRDLKIMEDIPSAPPQELIDVYRADGNGLTIEQYREFENSHKITEKITHLRVDRSIWRDEEQKNNASPFFEVIRGKEFLAERLYQEFVEAKKPVPKVAGETRPEKPSVPLENNIALPQTQQPVIAVERAEETEAHETKNNRNENEEDDDWGHELYATFQQFQSCDIEPLL